MKRRHIRLRTMLVRILISVIIAPTIFAIAQRKGLLQGPKPKTAD